MKNQRRFMPSLSLLSAFNAVLHSGSISAAARELQLSQSTVSRLVQNLEAQLGRELFSRTRKRLLPTPAAVAYGREISTALDLIQRASMGISANLGGGVLSLAILPAFGTRWLAPRLGSFLSANPGVTINLSTHLSGIDFKSAGVDAAVYFGNGDWIDAGHLKLFDENLTACVAPSVLEHRQIKSFDDVRDLQLFQIQTRPQAWNAWFEGQGIEAQIVRGMLFDQFAPMVESAIAGLGVALLPKYLADIEIAAGRLKSIMRPTVSGTGAYWLAWPNDRDTHQPLRAFRDWLSSELTA